MSTVPAREIKRRGISAVDEALATGPVHVIRDDEAKYVVLSEEDYRMLLSDLADARLAASEADAKAGRIKRTSVGKLLTEIEG
jgi:PHD/YefM family antitoxin component YafN of YafNO toxin-antitoxin module